MKKFFIVLLLAIVVVGGAGTAAFFHFEGPAVLNMFTAASARQMCSGVFAAGREESHVRQQEFGRQTSPGKYLGMVTLELDYTAKSVTTSLFGFGERQAIFRDGIGCTSNEGISEAELRAQGSGGRITLAPADPKVLWPEGSATLENQLPPGVDGDKLRAVVAEAFAEPEPDQPRETRGVVVVHQGRILAEQYRVGFDQNSGQLSNSMAKTITGALIGILVRDGKLNVDAPAPIEEWSDPDDPRSAITLEHLLRMQSGLEFAENYTRVKSDITMMYASGDLAGFTAAKPLEAPPGSQWKYSTGTSNILGRIVSENAGATWAERLSFPRRELFEPLGMQHTVLEVDGKGTFIGGSAVYATPRDYARFGLLYLRDGVWNGRQILPPGWVEYSLTPTSNAPAHRSYGVQLWLNTGVDPEVLHWPELPADTFMLLGHQGQYVVVIPSRDLVVVRSGMTEFNNWHIGTFVRDIMTAIGL